MILRLDKFISANSAYSRSEIRTAARRGKILVNGQIQRAFDFKIDTDYDKVSIYENEISSIGNVYLVMNKPAGVISASNDKNKETVVDLVPEQFKHLDLFPVGRLDRDTTGLLIITNDGDFAHKVISPKNDVEKCYEVELDADLTEDLVEKFSKGVVLADGTQCKSAVLEILDSRNALITITEGKYHQVKRMFGVFGLGVNRLHRRSIGGLSLPKHLEPRQCLQIDGQEIMDKVLK